MTKNNPRTIVYIDGFNLYYGCLKGTPHRWLDVCAFADRLLPRNHVIAVKYFTARVSDTTDDPQQSTRQDTYLRALQAQPRLALIEGTFLFKRRRLRLAPGQRGAPGTVEVLVAEEKGSDVNLAVHLLHDGHLGRYDAAVVISNDSDLQEAVRLVRDELRLPIGVVSPHGKVTAKLYSVATFTRPIRKGHLVASQFPDAIRDADGRTIRKPNGW